MTSNQLYSLTWGEYGTSLISAVQLLRCHGELVDVTLAAGGRTFHAHKVVLCAASPFLLDLLKSTTCKHPVVMLAGVQAEDLEALLEFVYKGEVSVDPNQLPSLLQAAHCLSIQGLSPTSIPVNCDTVQQAMKPENTKLEMNQDDLRVSSGEEVLIKRKKRAKRLSKSPILPIHSGKIFVQSNSNSTDVNLLGTTSPDVSSGTSWTQSQQLLQSPVIVQNVTNENNSTTQPTNTPSTPRIRGASDEPGVCPLCGALLRQARNLKRHLVTSCKYRMLNGTAQVTATPETQLNRTQEELDSTAQELETIKSISNVERLTHSTECTDTKLVLNPISCTELLPSSSSISISSNTM